MEILICQTEIKISRLILNYLSSILPSPAVKSQLSLSYPRGQPEVHLPSHSACRAYSPQRAPHHAAHTSFTTAWGAETCSPQTQPGRDLQGSWRNHAPLSQREHHPWASGAVQWSLADTENVKQESPQLNKQTERGVENKTHAAGDRTGFV